MGQAPKGDSYNDSQTGLPLIAGAGDFAGALPSPKKYTTAPGKVCEAGDIILGIRASIGDRVWSDGEYCLGRGVAGLRAESALDSKYLWHWLGFNAQRIAAKGRGATFLQVTRKDIADLEIALPALTEQRRIAAMLDEVDALRSKCRVIGAHIDDLTQSIFVQMFGDPVRNPMRWQRVELGMLSNQGLRNGAYFPKHAYKPDGIEMAHMSDVFYDRVSRGNLKRVRATAQEIRKYLATGDDILIARRSLNYGGAGKPCLVPASAEPLLFESSLIRFSPDQRLVTPSYIFHLLKDPYFRRSVMSKIITGTTIFGVSQSNLSRLEVPLPPLDLQDKFAAALDRQAGVKNPTDKMGVLVDELFASVESRAFSGQL